MEEVKMLEEDIEAVKEKVDDPMMCEKVRLFIYAPQEIQQFYKEESCEFRCLVDKVRLTRLTSGGGNASDRDRTEEFGASGPFKTADASGCQVMGEVSAIHQVQEGAR